MNPDAAPGRILDGAVEEAGRNPRGQPRLTGVTVRPFNEDDRGFCVRSFALAYERSPWARYATLDHLRDLISALLDDPRWSVAVACSAEATDVVLGWIAWRKVAQSENPAIGWLQVRRDFRRRGIAWMLLRHIGIMGGDLSIATMVGAVDGAGTPTLNDLASARGIRLRFRPLLLSEHPGSARKRLPQSDESLLARGARENGAP